MQYFIDANQIISSIFLRFLFIETHSRSSIGLFKIDSESVTREKLRKDQSSEYVKALNRDSNKMHRPCALSISRITRA